MLPLHDGDCAGFPSHQSQREKIAAGLGEFGNALLEEGREVVLLDVVGITLAEDLRREEVHRGRFRLREDQ